MYENVFDFVCLLDLNADAHAVDAWLDQDAFIFIPGDSEGV